MQNRSGYGIMTRYAPVAQLDRAQASDAWCRRFESCSVRQKQADCPKGAVCLFFVHFDRFEPHARKSVTFAPGKETVCTTFGANTGSKSCSVPSPFCDLHRFVRETLSILLTHSTYPIQNLTLLQPTSNLFHFFPLRPCRIRANML